MESNYDDDSTKRPAGIQPGYNSCMDYIRENKVAIIIIVLIIIFLIYWFWIKKAPEAGALNVSVNTNPPLRVGKGTPTTAFG
jgi:hypothetical protein